MILTDKVIVLPGQDDLVGELWMTEALAADRILASVLDNGLLYAALLADFNDAGWEALGKLDGILSDNGFLQGDLGQESIIGDG